ncbi:hypothetical protein SASK001_09810 [Staphylococcus argenteus]|nr:hypothetical protein SA19082_07530 [Staphylococcus argenteus]GJF51470.1 hypothetical protein SA19086_07770 [Staphylococcus argenteus]GJF56091.1 hypothetical protein SA19103_02310 [Staphylococcus argenteus]GJF63888.1 hypothetical protein SA19133_02290 [Staphylococcus argenteus]GJF87024.1 hypothetical protein SA20092_02300 [Staphylococcus argenteus]
MTTFFKKWIWSSFGQVNALCIYFFKSWGRPFYILVHMNFNIFGGDEMRR